MKRERDTHRRLRGNEGGRLSAGELARQDLALAMRELELALDVGDLKTAKEHAALAKKFVTEATRRLG